MSWRCPSCGSDDLDVQMAVWGRLIQHDEEDFETVVEEAQDTDQEWFQCSPMKCRSCGHVAPVNNFEQEE